jgi:hypothetical protein
MTWKRCLTHGSHSTIHRRRSFLHYPYTTVLGGCKVTAKRIVKPQVELPPEPLRGEARGVQIRSEPRPNGSIDILTFRVERFDQQGDRLAPIPVEMEGTIRGVLNEGDKVEINADWKAGQTLAPKRFRNLTTGGEVGIPTVGLGGRILGYVVIAFIALIAVTVIGLIIHDIVIHGLH